MSSVLEHIAVILHYFHLYTYESPSGRDTIIDGYICPGKNPDVVFGMPYPFFNNGGSPENPAYPMPTSAFPQPAAMQPAQTPAPAQSAQPAEAQGTAHPDAAAPDPAIGGVHNATPATPGAPAAPAAPVN